MILNTIYIWQSNCLIKEELSHLNYNEKPIQYFLELYFRQNPFKTSNPF